MPMGTGNDSADVASWEDGLDTLEKAEDLRTLGAVKIKDRNNRLNYAYNIVSLGIDAYVNYLNNYLKKRIPGNFYKLFSDLAVFFYGRTIKYAPSFTEITDSEGNKYVEQRQNAIQVLGVSGYRSYGNGRWVLPGLENYCSIKKGNLLQNIRFKSLLFKAEHHNLPGCIMKNVTALKIRYEGSVPMQMDGEDEFLGKDSFPLEMTIIDTSINCLTSKKIPELRRLEKALAKLELKSL